MNLQFSGQSFLIENAMVHTSYKRSTVPPDIRKQLLPISEAQDVVDRVGDTTNHIESFGQTESDHVLPRKSGLRHLLFRKGEHFLGEIHSPDLIVFHQVLQYPFPESADTGAGQPRPCGSCAKQQKTSRSYSGFFRLK